MKHLIVVVLLTLMSFTASAQDQSQCDAALDAQLKEMYALNQSYAGSVQYKEMSQTFMSCMQSGKCGKPEALIGLMEAMVDEEVISIQRRKLAAIKAFFIRMRESRNDSCTASREFPAVLDQLRVLNKAQLDRFVTYSKEFVDQQAKGK